MPVQVDTIKGTQLRVLMGDGNSPENFVEWCIINTDRGVQWDTAGSDEEVPFCDQPETPGWTQHTKTSLSGTITGAGKLATDYIDNVWPWLVSDDAKTLRVEVGTRGYWEGQWKLTAFQVTGGRSGKAEANLTMKSHGEQDWVANS